MVVFAETGRLLLRPLEKRELPRLVELMDDWDVVRWLVVVPFPYTMGDAEAFYASTERAKIEGTPEFYAIALKSTNLLIGGVGLHPPRGSDHAEGDVEIGYWLGKNYWGHGFMSEAVHAVAALSFARPTTRALVATTSPNNKASQNVLRKLGMHKGEIMPLNYPVLRGGTQTIPWRLTREERDKRHAVEGGGLAS